MYMFPKNILTSGQYVVEFRNGIRALCLDNRLVGEDMGDMLYNYNCDLTHKYHQPSDICVIYKDPGYYTFEAILRYADEIVWSRENIIKISKQEALKKLKKFYGENVEIED